MTGPALDCTAFEVFDLTGIEYLTELQVLTLYGTSDISPLAEPTGLKLLYLYDTDVTDVSPLDDLVANGLRIDW